MSATPSVFLEAGDFATSHCVQCRREVLTYPDEGRPGEEGVRRCLHCDTSVAGDLRWIDVADLGALGYTVDTGEDAAGGCATCTSGCVVRSVSGRGGG